HGDGDERRRQSCHQIANRAVIGKDRLPQDRDDEEASCEKREREAHPERPALGRAQHALRRDAFRHGRESGHTHGTAPANMRRVVLRGSTAVTWPTFFKMEPMRSLKTWVSRASR